MFRNFFENLTITQVYDLLNAKFSLIGVLCFLIFVFFAIRLIKRSVSIINFIANLPKPLLAGMFSMLAAGFFGYSVIDIFSRESVFSPQTNGFLMSASLTVALVALRYESGTNKE